MAQAYKFGGKSLVLLQVNCRSICNKMLEFWNLIDTYNPDVVIGTESWLSEEISSAEIFRDDYITFRRDRCSRGVECSFVLKVISIAGSCGPTRTLRCYQLK
jgi:hypothetical protein